MASRADVLTFAKFYVGLTLVLLVASAVLSSLLAWAYLSMAALVLSLIGFAYVAASVLAWSGAANMYRFSPTLLVGSRTYRDVLAQNRSAYWTEGRDTEAFLHGLALGGALLGTGAALADPAFLLVDAVVVAAVAVFLRSSRPRPSAGSPNAPSQGPR